MLILHQTGSVRVGEVVRYTLTYTPSLDRILPPPTHLHVKIKNTSAVPLRAAYLHGPYTLYTACYPSTYDPNVRQDNTDEEGTPDFEPQLKAGGHWYSKLKVPEEVRQDVDKTSITRDPNVSRKSATWIIEVASQVLFSVTAAVHFEVLVGRDERSVDLGFHGVIGSGQGVPGKLEDHQLGRSRNSAQPKGVFSKAVRLAVDDTESLWNTPAFPKKDERGSASLQQAPQHGDKRDAGAKKDKKSKKQKKIHLVMLTHGLHSNLGADMLYMKESIDTAARQAREDSRKRKQEARASKLAEANDFGRQNIDERSKSAPEIALAPTNSITDEDEDEDEEQVLVRGFNGNAVKTEKGIQYLGKRFAKYVLSLTYPDQPFLPVKSSISKSITRTFTNQKAGDEDGKKPIHKNSSIVKDEKHTNHDLPYKITSISFIGHSLGGLVQTYAIAYIQKHSPGFFDLIKPVNFVAMATPFLGLSNENPMYVKFALDFGLVGRTGQDLGLTWRAPTLARKGWGAMMPDFGNDTQKKQETNPGAKPLLRILPTGPAHSALKKFRNRTVYSNVVNDGIVPLRTSCLLFLDWRGLERVEKARRENGLIGTMVEWGWTEMMGQNASAPRQALPWKDIFGDSGDESSRPGKISPDPGSQVPQAEASQGIDEDQKDPSQHQFLDNRPSEGELYNEDQQKSPGEQATTMWQGFLSFFRPQQAGNPKPTSTKTQKMYHRGQTMAHHGDSDSRTTSQESSHDRPGPMIRGPSLYSANGGVNAPPKTTVFESAGDLLNPPLPPKEYILDPATRPRTIFHDRVYHPDDIPAPPTKKQRTFLRRQPSRESAMSAQSQSQPQPPQSQPPSQQLQATQYPAPRRPSSVHSNDTHTSTTTVSGPMKIEEKIARAYHRDLSWRKVLVSLEPDAHNNMIVRRMFANAYGWPVVKHMCDTHFAFTKAAMTRDEDEVSRERAGVEMEDEVGGLVDGEEVRGQTEPPGQAKKDGEREKEKERSRTLQVPVAGRRASADASVDKKKPLSEKQDLQDDVSRLPLHDRTKALREEARTGDGGKDKDDNDPATGKTRDHRSPSEIRESADHVPDLVSHINATGTTVPPSGSISSNISTSSSPPKSAAASASYTSTRRALSNLSRRDSGRWSDRYFGSDDEEDEEELLEERQFARELAMAVERGGAPVSKGSKDSKSSAGSAGRGGDKPIGSGSGSTTGTQDNTKPGAVVDAAGIVAGVDANAPDPGSGGIKTRGKRGKSILNEKLLVEEPGEMGGDEQEDLVLKTSQGQSQSQAEYQKAKANARDQPTPTPTPTTSTVDEQILGLTGLGLQKSVEEQIQTQPQTEDHTQMDADADANGQDGDRSHTSTTENVDRGQSGDRAHRKGSHVAEQVAEGIAAGIRKDGVKES